MSWFTGGVTGIVTFGFNALLNGFNKGNLEETAQQTIPVAKPADLVDAALREQRWDDVAALYKGDGKTLMTPDLRRRIEGELLGSDQGRQVLANRPDLAGKVLSAADPALLQHLDLARCFGNAKDSVMSEAVMAISRKSKPYGMELDRDEMCDPARFTLLAQQISPDIWNDVGAGIGQKRGLGPTVCGQLWAKMNYDQICELIDLGVDTSTSATQPEGMKGVKVRGGRIQPIQHLISPLLKQVDALPAVADPRKAPARSQAEGARKIIAAMNSNGGSKTLTSYAEVKSCEMLTEFKKKPGTIWGFEEVRQPYVQAAHELLRASNHCECLSCGRPLNRSRRTMPNTKNC